MLSTQPFLVDDFTGGLNDSPTCPKTCYLKADNLFLTVTDNWISRPGSVVYDTAAAQLPTGIQRVGTLINFNKDDTLLAHSGNRLFYYNAGAWTEILGPTGNPALIGATTAGRLSVAEWKKHLFITSTEQIAPVKVLKNGVTWVAYTAGLPLMATPANYVSATVLANSITLANSLKTNLNTHFASVTLHRVADAASAAIVTAPNATDLPSLVTLVGQLVRAYQNHYNDSNGVGAYHYPYVAPGTPGIYFGAPFTSTAPTVTAAPTDLVSCATSLNDLKLRFNVHSGMESIHGFGALSLSESNPFITGVTSGPNAVFDPTYLYSVANTIKARYNAHLADGGTATTAHSTLADSTNTIVAADATTPETLQGLIWAIRLSYNGNGAGGTNGHELDAQKSAAWAFHIAKEGTNHDLPGGASSIGQAPDFYGGCRAGDWQANITALNDLRKTLNAHMQDLTAHYTTKTYIAAGSSIQKTTYLISGVDITLANYNYALVYTHTYTIGSTTFKTVSAPIYFAATNVIKIGLQNLVINNIQALSNGGATNYDTANIKIEIYRTIDVGTTYFLVDTISNGTTSYSDGVTDAELLARAVTLYTSGGVLTNDTPPLAKFVHTLNNYAYYANTAANPNRIIQSLPSTLDGVPGANYVDLPQDVQGISSTRGVLVGWTASAAYRIEGSYDLKGQGQMNYIGISNITGLFASLSPVQMEDGIVFCGNDGFYFTDGYRVQRISRYWAQTYANLIATTAKAGFVQGTYDRKNRRIWWGVSSGGAESDSCVVLDLNFPLTENAIFTTLSGGANFAPTAVCYFAGQMLRGDSRGYVFKHDPIYTSDPKVNTGASASTWNKAWVTYLFKSPAYDFGVIQVRKWISQIVVKSQNLGTNLSLQVISNNDDGRVVANLAPIRFRGGTQMIEEKRKFPAGSLRCMTKQIQLTNAKVIITNSDTLGLATVDSTAKTLTLLSGSWPADLSDQVVTLVSDNYVTEWTILSQTSTVLTLSDAGNTLPANANYKWQIKGYPKDEKFELVSYSLPVALLGSSQQSAQGESGANV